MCRRFIPIFLSNDKRKRSPRKASFHTAFFFCIFCIITFRRFHTAVFIPFIPVPVPCLFSARTSCFCFSPLCPSFWLPVPGFQLLSPACCLSPSFSIASPNNTVFSPSIFTLTTAYLLCRFTLTISSLND